MDLATLIGIVGALIVTVLANIIGGGNPVQLVSSPIPIMLCVIGAMLVTAASFPLSVLTGLPKFLGKSFMKSKEDMAHEIETIVKMADKARREGLLALEEDAKKLHDPFLRRGVQLVVDGVDPAQVRSIMEADVHAMAERHHHGISFFEKAGGYAPTMGIIGTVMELIVLMQHLDDPSKLGHGIAAAFLATWWGLGAANFIYMPIAGKLKTNSDEEVTFRKMLMDGVLALQAGENPRVVKEKLSAYLPPKQRAAEAAKGAKAKVEA